MRRHKWSRVDHLASVCTVCDVQRCKGNGFVHYHAKGAHCGALLLDARMRVPFCVPAGQADGSPSTKGE